MSDTTKPLKQTTLGFSPSASTQQGTPSSKRTKNEMIASPPLTLESMKEEVAEIKNVVAESIQNLTEQVTKAFNTANAEMLSTIEKKMDNVMSVVDEDRKTTQRISSNVDQLVVSGNEMQLRINHLEQEKLNNSIEVSGIPSNHFTRTTSLKQLASDLLKSYSIEHSFETFTRVYARDIKVNSENKKLLIITFANYDEKSRIMKLKRHNEKEKPVTIFFGHVLTQQNRLLFMRARKVAKSLGINQVYVAYGRIYMKNDGNLRGTLIKSHSDIDTIENSKSLSSQSSVLPPPKQNNGTSVINQQ